MSPFVNKPRKGLALREAEKRLAKLSADVRSLEKESARVRRLLGRAATEWAKAARKVANLGGDPEKFV